MKLTVIGCSPAWTNPGGAHSGYLVESGEHSLLIDCGPGVLGRLRLQTPWPEPDAIVLTHFHLDHWGDLVPWVWGAAFRVGSGTETPKPELWTPPGGTDLLGRFGALLGYADMFDRAFVVSEYEPGEPFVAGGHTLTAAKVAHYGVDGYALRVTGGGRTLAYSGDSGPSDALVETARDADLFLCEATLRAAEDDGELRGHLSLDEARAAFELSGARSLLITHRPVELDRPAGVAFAHDGLSLEV